MKALYVSYDGALDPLGASQVLPYLLRLTRAGVAFTLVSFEKSERWAEVPARTALMAKLASAAVRWRPLRYHKQPRLPATLFDFLAGLVAVRREIREGSPAIVHCRGEVATAIARLAVGRGATRLLYDVRGFFADERAESGSWTRGGAVDRAVRSTEGRNLSRADAIVVLTHAGLDHLRQSRPVLPPHRVIPTCVDLEAFRPGLGGVAPDYGAIYVGSFSARYMPAETVALGQRIGRELGSRALFLTPNVDAATQAGVTAEWADVRSAQPEEVPGWLSRGRAVFFLYRPGLHVRATFPTRLGEALATGLPVVTNRGIGDLDTFIESEGVGVLLKGFTADAFDDAAHRLKALLEDPGTGMRCRRLAESQLGIELGVSRYLELYRMLTT